MSSKQLLLLTGSPQQRPQFEQGRAAGLQAPVQYDHGHLLQGSQLHPDHQHFPLNYRVGGLLYAFLLESQLLLSGKKCMLCDRVTAHIFP